MVSGEPACRQAGSRLTIDDSRFRSCLMEGIWSWVCGCSGRNREWL